MEFQPEYWHWIVLGMVLMLLEAMLASFTILWVGAAAVMIGMALWLIPGIPLAWQLFCWAVLSSLLALAWFKYLKPLSADKTTAGLSKEAIVGEIGQVIVLPTEHKRGTVRFPAPVLGSDEWNFLTQDELSIGDRVTVVDVSGNSLVVKKL